MRQLVSARTASSLSKGVVCQEDRRGFLIEVAVLFREPDEKREGSRRPKGSRFLDRIERCEIVPSGRRSGL